MRRFGAESPVRGSYSTGFPGIGVIAKDGGLESSDNFAARLVASNLDGLVADVGIYDMGLHEDKEAVVVDPNRINRRLNTDTSPPSTYDNY